MLMLWYLEMEQASKNWLLAKTRVGKGRHHFETSLKEPQVSVLFIILASRRAHQRFRSELWNHQRTKEIQPQLVKRPNTSIIIRKMLCLQNAAARHKRSTHSFPSTGILFRIYLQPRDTLTFWFVAVTPSEASVS